MPEAPMRTRVEVEALRDEAAKRVKDAVSVQQLIAARVMLDTLKWVLEAPGTGSLEQEVNGGK